MKGYSKNTNVTKNRRGYIKSYIRLMFNVTATALYTIGKVGRVTLVTSKKAKRNNYSDEPTDTNLYINIIKVDIFNVTDVTALYTFINQLVRGYINDVT